MGPETPGREPSPGSDARRQAEERLGLEDVPVDPGMSTDVAELVHELRVHRVQLEIQRDELRATEVRLQGAVERYTDLYDGAPVGYLTLDGEGRIVEANLPAAALFQVDSDRLIGRALQTFVLRVDQDELRLHRRRLHRERRHAGRVRLARADGAPLWVRLEETAFSRAGDRDARSQVALSDISAQKEAEAASELLTAIVESSRDAISTTTLEGTITTWNAAAQRLYGYAPEEVIGRSVAMLAPPDVYEQLEALLDNVRDGVRVDDHDAVHLRKDGTPVDVSLSLSPVKDAAGSVIGAATITRDVSDRKRAELEVHRLNEELETFAYSISHDLRAPLRAIDGFSQIVLEDAGEKLGEENAAYLRRVRRGVERMATLIDDLLGLSRLARRDVVVKEVDLSATAEEVITDLRAAEPEREVETVVAPGMIATADGILLRDILVNLLGNAWKFTGRHEMARIEVGETRSDGERTWFVRDDGAGFDMERAKYLFGPFQRYHTQEEFAGDGIGLATVKRLVTRHGGRVWAEAEVENGATFSFTLSGNGAPSA